MQSSGKRILALIACCAGILWSIPAQAINYTATCHRIKTILRSQADNTLTKFALREHNEGNGVVQFHNVDLDEDDMADTIVRTCPADGGTGGSCTLALTMSTGPSFKYGFPDGERFYLVRLNQRIVAVANRPGAPATDTKLYIMVGEGIRQICN